MNSSTLHYLQIFFRNYLNHLLNFKISSNIITLSNPDIKKRFYYFIPYMKELYKN